MTAPRQYACEVCRRPLNRYLDANGQVSYRHPAHLPVDHPPVTRRADQVPGVVRCCDFCCVEGANAWLYTTKGDISVLATGPAGGQLNQYGTDWAACPLCADAVAAGDVHALNARAEAVAGALVSPVTRPIVAAVLAATQPGRRFLLDGTEGPPPDLAPAALPRIRDRLTVLLNPDHALSTLDGCRVRDQVAAGLPMSRLYALDDTFTAMAVAAAPSLRAASIAAVTVPAPFGLLLWQHPVDDHHTVAASWATDGDTVHIVGYRALGTALTGPQLQRLREQAGWLTATGWATLRPDHGIGGDHPAAVLMVTWLLIGHRLAEQVPVAVDRRIRAAHARAGRPTPDVRLVQLRGSAHPHPTSEPRPDGPVAAGGRTPASHRWWVSPFVRNQPHGPGRTLRKPTLVLPFVNGPRGKPVRASTTVRILAVPRPRPADLPPDVDRPAR